MQWKDTWKTLSWSDLEIHMEGRLVLRHNKHLQYGYTIKPEETLKDALLHMESYCKLKPMGNPRITGLIAVVRCTRLNNRPLPQVLSEKFFRF